MVFNLQYLFKVAVWRISYIDEINLKTLHYLFYDNGLQGCLAVIGPMEVIDGALIYQPSNVFTSNTVHIFLQRVERFGNISMSKLAIFFDDI